MKRRTIAAVCALAALLVSSAYCRLHAAESVDIYDQKLKVESQMEAKLKKTLAPWLGTENIIAVVRLELADGGDKAKSGNVVRKWDESEELVLPGVPAATSMTKKSRSEETPKGSRLGLANISVSLLIDKKLKKEKMDQIHRLVVSMFGMDMNAGDVLTVESYRAPSSSLGFPGASTILLTLLLALLGVFLFGPVMKVLRTLNENIPAFVAAQTAPVRTEETDDEEKFDDEDRDAGHAAPLIIERSGAVAGPAGSAADNADLAGIVTKDNIENLRQALGNESPAVIATVIQRLPSELAFLAIPEGKINAVLAEFTRVRFENSERVKQNLRRVKSRVEWCFGGAMNLARILQSMDRKLQENTLTLLVEKDPDFAMQVERRLFRFIDLLYYEETALKRIFRKAGIDPFVKCMKECAEDVVNLFYQKLGPSITDLIAERLKTTVSAGGSTEAENKILQAIDELHRKGYVQAIEEIKEMQEKMEKTGGMEEVAAAETNPEREPIYADEPLEIPVQPQGPAPVPAPAPRAEIPWTAPAMPVQTEFRPVNPAPAARPAVEEKRTVAAAATVPANPVESPVEPVAPAPAETAVPAAPAKPVETAVTPENDVPVAHPIVEEKRTVAAAATVPANPVESPVEPVAPAPAETAVPAAPAKPVEIAVTPENAAPVNVPVVEEKKKPAGWPGFGNPFETKVKPENPVPPTEPPAAAKPIEAEAKPAAPAPAETAVPPAPEKPVEIAVTPENAAPAEIPAVEEKKQEAPAAEAKNEAASARPNLEEIIEMEIRAEQDAEAKAKEDRPAESTPEAPAAPKQEKPKPAAGNVWEIKPENPGLSDLSSPAEKKETPAQPAAEKPVEPEVKPAAPAPAAEPAGAEKKADENIEDIGIAKICRSVAKGFFHIDDDKKS
jgi:hypothetical protein